MRLLTTLRRLLVALAALLGLGFGLVGCGGGGGSSVGMPAMPSVSIPSVSTTDTTPPANTNTGGPAVVNGGTASALNPGTTPSLPSLPPPRSAKKAASGAKTSPNASSVTISLAPGWSLISFPFGHLQSASGFTYQLYTFAQGTFIAVDPQVSPASVDTRYAYLAYTDTSETVTVTGTANDGSVTSVPLVQGWNLLGCPSALPLSWSNMSATRLHINRVIEEVATFNLNPSDTWLYQQAFQISGSVVSVTDILAPQAAISPQGGYWMFVWQDATLNLNVTAPATHPAIASLSTATLTAGQPLTISGSGFGSAASGSVTLGGLSVSDNAVTSWSDTSIQLTIPPGVSSGNVVVFAGSYPSNRVAETSAGGPSTGTATLTGLVQSSAGAPLSGAQIFVDSGQMGVSASDGTFTVTDIPAGEHLVLYTRLGYNVGSGITTFASGETKSVLVSLSTHSGGGGGTSTSGTLYVNAYPWSSGGVSWYPSRIEVDAYDGSKYWYNTWGSNIGEVTLTCSSATVGAYYTVYITFTNPNTGDTVTGTWSVQLATSSQTVTHYGPYSKR
ncbi:MAG: hypothetical protein EB084_10460 [Proteobacteria bacterium]|nr:hypothetical protein [Pseudomonadota bacterium]